MPLILYLSNQDPTLKQVQDIDPFTGQDAIPLLIETGWGRPIPIHDLTESLGFQ